MIYANYDNKVQSGYDSVSMEFDSLFQDLNEVDADIRTWTRKAERMGFDVQETLDKIAFIKAQMPSLQYDSARILANFRMISQNPANEVDQSVIPLLPLYSHIKQKRKIELILIFQNRMRRYYLCELIYKCAEHAIIKLQADAEKQYPPKSPKWDKSSRSISWLKKQLPKKVDDSYLKAKDYTQVFLNMQKSCNCLFQNLDDERQKLELSVS